MKSRVDRSAPDPLGQDLTPVATGDQPLDVPGMLAGRIGDLYAAEERLRRQARTDRLLRRAAEPIQE